MSRPPSAVRQSLADWLSWQETLHPSAIDLGLDRLRRTLDRLQWQAPTCPVVTVAGTNGKGSSVALLTRILTAAGYRTGTFTSPHLLRYNERVAIGEREISDASLIAAFERIDEARGADTLTFFEFNALAALLIFATAHPDAIVLEIGMGGRLDAANVVDADVALVTSIGLDHCAWLGNSLEAIGREKAGIFRAGRPAVFGSPDMPDSIAAVAAQTGSELLRAGHDFAYRRDGSTWSWQGRRVSHAGLPAPALFGDIQFDNASAVLAVLECLAPRLPVTREAIERGLRSVHLPGRFQVIPGEPDWILDVAHNPAAAQALAAQLRARPCAGKTIAVCGMLGDKDIESVAAALRGVCEVWIVAGLSGPRAVDGSQLSLRLSAAGIVVTRVAADIAAACAAARDIARCGDRVVVFGSFLAVGPALQWLDAEKRLAASGKSNGIQL